MISLNSVSKTFKQSWWQKKGTANHSNGGIINAVDGVSFTCEPGRIFGLIGPNGAGKTTTLRMIATMLKPTSGTIHVCDTDVVTNPMKVRQKMGFLSGNTGLYDRWRYQNRISESGGGVGRGAPRVKGYDFRPLFFVVTHY